ncbi:conserved Plasmodium protein, unknown function [Plasmodium ovale wallikeri]|uniref:Uncharacterized protein n=1 Tax=Plasmodium ovale wallikeri TaxID=864142 RepID=A0A1A9A2B9_PLAOA|nr:conserved Plasmodium protein, unknown function [Plasmodium ovale wallikeri]
MENAPKKRLKINELEYKLANPYEFKQTGDKEVRGTDHEIYPSAKIWICNKISNICHNILKPNTEAKNEEKKEKKKRSFDEISKVNNEDVMETGTYRNAFEYLSLLKSLLCIYKFYTTYDGKCMMICPDLRKEYIVKDRKYICEDGHIYVTKVENAEKKNEEKEIISYKQTDCNLQNYKIKENYLLKDNINKYFINLVNENCGFFFIFNTIFFTYLKNYYYFVDIINILNYIGYNSNGKKKDENNKDIFIYEQIALFIENHYNVVIYDTNSHHKLHISNTVCKETGCNRKLVTAVRKNDYDIEKVKNNLEFLKEEKSFEELLFIAMNECNKKIYEQFSKIPDLFFDISEISEYSKSDYAKSEIIYSDNSEQKIKSLCQKETLSLYNENHFTTSMTFEELKNKDNVRNSISLKTNNSSTYSCINNENNCTVDQLIWENTHLTHNTSEKMEKQNEQIGQRQTIPKVTTSSSKHIDKNVSCSRWSNGRGSYITNFLMNLFKHAKRNTHTSEHQNGHDNYAVWMDEKRNGGTHENRNDTQKSTENKYISEYVLKREINAHSPKKSKKKNTIKNKNVQNNQRTYLVNEKIQKVQMNEEPMLGEKITNGFILRTNLQPTETSKDHSEKKKKKKKEKLNSTYAAQDKNECEPVGKKMARTGCTDIGLLSEELSNGHGHLPQSVQSQINEGDELATLEKLATDEEKHIFHVYESDARITKLRSANDDKWELSKEEKTHIMCNISSEEFTNEEINGNTSVNDNPNSNDKKKFNDCNEEDNLKDGQKEKTFATKLEMENNSLESYLYQSEELKVDGLEKIEDVQPISVNQISSEDSLNESKAIFSLSGGNQLKEVVENENNYVEPTNYENAPEGIAQKSIPFYMSPKYEREVQENSAQNGEVHEIEAKDNTLLVNEDHGSISENKPPACNQLNEHELNANDVNTLGGNAENVKKSDGNAENVNGLDENEENVTVSGGNAEIVTVSGGNAENVNESGENAENVNESYENAEIVAVSGVNAEIVTVSGVNAEIVTVSGGNAENVNESGGNAENVNESGGNAENVNESGGNAENVNESYENAEIVTVSGVNTENVTVSGGNAENVNESYENAEIVTVSGGNVENVNESYENAEIVAVSGVNAEIVTVSGGNAENVNESGENAENVNESYENAEIVTVSGGNAENVNESNENAENMTVSGGNAENVNESNENAENMTVSGVNTENVTASGENAENVNESNENAENTNKPYEIYEKESDKNDSVSNESKSSTSVNKNEDESRNSDLDNAESDGNQLSEDKSNKEESCEKDEVDGDEDNEVDGDEDNEVDEEEDDEEEEEDNEVDEEEDNEVDEEEDNEVDEEEDDEEEEDNEVDEEEDDEEEEEDNEVDEEEDDEEEEEEDDEDKEDENEEDDDEAEEVDEEEENDEAEEVDEEEENDEAEEVDEEEENEVGNENESVAPPEAHAEELCEDSNCTKGEKYELRKVGASPTLNKRCELSGTELESHYKELGDEEIINFLKQSKGSMDKNVYREYLRNLLGRDETCTIENHREEKMLFIKKVKKLCNLVKNKKFNDKYIKAWQKKSYFTCCKLQRAYKIFLVTIFSIVKEIKKLKKELNCMRNFIFINSGIENYLNENNISIVKKDYEDNDKINKHLSENNNSIINNFFLKKDFFSVVQQKAKKKYISYVPLKNYKILFLPLKQIFNEKNIQKKLKHISYYIEFNKYIPEYCSMFYEHFKIKENYLYHIQSLFNNAIPTVQCINMFITCLNYNYGKIYKKKSVFTYELSNTYLSTFPYVYCCDVQIVKHREFLKLKETCHKIIKNNEIYDNFANHLSSYVYDDSYFIIPFFSSYGKFLIIIKINKNKNFGSSVGILKYKNFITYDVIINSFVFPNDSSFQAIVHFSHIFINTLMKLFKTRNSDENIPEIIFANLPHVEKQKLIYHEIESSKNRGEIIINMIFLIESFFNNTHKMKAPKEFNQGLRFLYIIRLLEFYYEKS